MTSTPLTAAQVNSIPADQRTYTCQQCGSTSRDAGGFRMVTFLKIGFVICLTCIIGEESS